VSTPSLPIAKNTRERTEHTLHRERRLSDPWALDEFARDGRQSRKTPLTHSLRSVDRGIVGGFDKGLRDTARKAGQYEGRGEEDGVENAHVRHKLLRFENVLSGTLELVAVAEGEGSQKELAAESKMAGEEKENRQWEERKGDLRVSDRNHNGRWIMADHVKPAHRGKVRLSLAVDGGDEADGSRGLRKTARKGRKGQECSPLLALNKRTMAYKRRASVHYRTSEGERRTHRNHHLVKPSRSRLNRINPLELALLLTRVPQALLHTRKVLASIPARSRDPVGLGGLFSREKWGSVSERGRGKEEVREANLGPLPLL
jgi:hypothetical protein